MSTASPPPASAAYWNGTDLPYTDINSAKYNRAHANPPFDTSATPEPFPLNAALSTLGMWPTAVVGAVWAVVVALTAWRPYRILGLSAAAALLLASLIVVYH